MEEARLEKVWGEIWDLLEQGSSDRAAARALQALNDEEAPEIRYLLGVSLLDLDETAAARPELERAAAELADWPEAHVALGWAQFRLLDLDGADDSVTEALRLDPELAEAHQLRGLLAERDGDAGVALVAFAEARRLDPERYPEPYEMDQEEFLDVARRAIDELDAPILRVLEDTAFFVQPFPAEELLRGDDPPLDPQLLGLFLGRSLVEQSVQDSGTMPNTLYLFQNNLQRAVTTREELEDEIRITTLHEIGHHLGWDEEELAERGLA